MRPPRAGRPRYGCRAPWPVRRGRWQTVRRWARPLLSSQAPGRARSGRSTRGTPPASRRVGRPRLRDPVPRPGSPPCRSPGRTGRQRRRACGSCEAWDQPTVPEQFTRERGTGMGYNGLYTGSMLELNESAVSVLIADDDSLVRMVMRMVMQQLGYEVVEASNSDEFTSAITARTFGL